MIVPIDEVLPNSGWVAPSDYSLWKFIEVIDRQGLIEPLVVVSIQEVPYQIIGMMDSDRLEACKFIGFDTIIVAELGIWEE